MGLIVWIYRSAELGDCTNGGVSSRHDKLCLVNVPGPFNPTEDCPAAWLVPGNIPHSCHIVTEQSMRWSMHGGNFAHSCDARFGAAVLRVCGRSRGAVGPVAIHDRYED